MAFINSPNMSLPIPVVGSEPGPNYAQDVNNALTLVDAHDHTPGNGVQITPAGININTALTMNSNALINTAYVTLVPQGSTPGVNTIYESGVDLYYVDGLGNNIRITQSGAVAGTPGSIANLVSPASASYVAGNSTFVWQSNTNIAANMDFGAAVMRNLSPNSTFALTLQPPAGLSSNFSITLPTLPSSQSFMTLDNAGNITAPIAFNLGITASNIANATITGNKIASTTITGSNLVNNTIGFTQLDPVIFQLQTQTFTQTTPSFSVKAATTANITLSGAQTIDGVSCVAGDIVLVKNQTTSAQNGVYVVAAGAWSRDTNYDTFTELNYAWVSVTSGTVNGGLNYGQNNILTSLSDAQSWTRSQTVSFTVPANVIDLFITAVGGGGGGGGGAANSNAAPGAGGGSGGGGAMPSNMKIVVAPADVINITIGAGGLGAAQLVSANSSGNSGSAGLSTVITAGSNTFTFNGAAGGVGGAVSNGSSAAAVASAWAGTGGTVGSGAGGTGNAANNAGTAGGTGSNTIYALGGSGGAGSTSSSIMPSAGGGGGGGAGIGAGATGSAGQINASSSSAGSDAAAGTGAGGGASGGCTSNSGTPRTIGRGGNGGSGKVIISYLGQP